MRNALVVPLMTLTATAFATPFGDQGRGFRDGANHHLGDDGFVAQLGRAPTRSDSENVRMKTHLQHVRALLASQPATKPALAKRRAEILGYLDDYIAKGITPVNEHLPWRTPVFIDDHGNICAVGYLIERTSGRALPERIAKTHRYELLEDIATAMPDVRDWVAASGFTLDELASIQPGYSEPAIEAFGRADHVAFKTPDGAYTDERLGGTTKGTLKKGHMEGAWTREVDGKVVGKGQLTRGRGTWTSFYPDGKKLAQGPFVDDDPHGQWTFFHDSGRVAAIGSFYKGARDGAWQFFNDKPNRPLLARGAFTRGSISGPWSHYDATGKLLATTRRAGNGIDPMSRGGILMTVVPGADRVRHEIHSFGGMDSSRLHMAALGNERLYFRFGSEIYDQGGNRLERSKDGSWTAAPCGWSAKRKQIAKNGDVTTMHRLLNREDADKLCTGAVAVDKKRAAALEATIGALSKVRAPSPKFVKELALGVAEITYGDLQTFDPPSNPGSEAHPENTDDLVRILAASMAWYVEYPHIDGRFAQVFPTLAGQWSKNDLETARYEATNPKT